MMYLRIEVRTVDLQFNRTIERTYQFLNAIGSPEDSLEFVLRRLLEACDKL